MAKVNPESSTNVDITPQTMSINNNDGRSEAFGARLRQAVGREPAASVARRLGFKPQTFDTYLKGRIPRADDGLRIADGLSLDFRWLMTGATGDVADMVTLPHFPISPSAGGGSLMATDEQAGEVAFRADWLRAIGVNPRQALVLFARGDSMEPTIRDGDMLIVDRSIDRVLDAGIYVVTVAGMVVVKRVQLRRDGTLLLRSDSGRYDDEVIPPDELHSIIIEGRVCWSGRPM